MKRSLLPAFLGALLATGSLLPPASAQEQPRRPRITLPPAAATPATPAPAPAPVVTWLSTTRLLTAETTVELRFPTNMVQTWTGEPMPLDDAGGLVPLTVTPSLRGTWVWRSQLSGVFVPSEEPRRDQVYTFSVRPDQRDLQGRPLPTPQPTLELKAPGLKLTARHPNWFREGRTQRTPRILLQFNDKVNPAPEDMNIQFVNKAGQSVRAAARLATIQDLPPRDSISPTFVQQALHTAGAAVSATNPPAPTLPLTGTLLVEPVESLPVGEKWRLEVTRLASVDGQTRLAEPVVIDIGDISPLHIEYSTLNNEVGAPKSISLHFNLQLPEDLPAEQVLNHVSILPKPPGYKATYERNSVHITGDFAHETKYQVNLTHGLRSADGRPMTTPYQESFLFKVLQPEVALPAFASNQLPSGRALLDVHTVNLESVRVRVKAADRESLIYALRAYRHYENPDDGGSENWENGNERSGFARIPFDAMPGQKIYEQEFESAAPLDDQDEFVIDWRQALNGRKVGALFVTVEGEARPEWQGKNRRFGAQAFVQLTDIGLAWKLAGTEAFVLAFSQATGQPLAGVSVTAYDSEKNEVGRTVTAADGTGRLDRSGASWLLAETTEDLHAVAIDGRESDGLGMWRFGVAYDWEPVREARREITVFTERPVYQPGHTVYFKAVSRLVDPEGVRLPAVPEKAVLKAYDAKGRLFHQRDVQFSASGSLDGALELPGETLGYHRLELELPALPKPAASARDAEPEGEDEGEEEEESGRRTDSFRAPFLVEEYKPNTFQITFDPDSFKLDGEKASLSLQANYLLGKPLAKAKLAWTASVGDASFHPDAFRGFSFLDSRDSYYWNEEGYHEVPDLGDDGAPTSSDNFVTTQARTDLTDDGRASLEFIVPKVTGRPRPRSVNIDAEVTDLNQQTITERWHQTFHSSAFYLGISRSDTMTGTGEPVDIALAAARPDGEPWSQPAEARVIVEKVDFISVRVQTVGGGSNIKTNAQRGVVAEAAVTVMPKGQESRPFTWTPREPGFYYITARATDPDGRPVESVASFQVFGSGWANWQDRDGVRIDLDADKTSYVEGETARVLVKSPVQGKALVTVERRSVLRHFFVDLTSNAQVIEVPVEAAMAPNVFVSVFVVRGADASPRQHKAPDYKVGFTELRVAESRSRLTVAVAPGQPAYRPGDQGVASAVVTDGRGAPVAGAEVTFWAADDGVLTLRPYSPPDLWSRFHQPQPLAVVTGTSLMALLAEDPQELAFTNKGYMIGGGDEGMDAGGDRLRRNFQPVAFYHGALTTDAEGRVSVPFTVPDNLTRFRLIAVAAAGPDSFGTGQGSFEFNKPLMIEPALPRFANVGDAITVKGIVLNNTDQAFETEITLTLDGLATSAEPLVKHVSLAPRGAEAVSFPLIFNEPGTGSWQWKARSITPGINLTDTVQSTLPVGYAQPVLREMHFATVNTKGESANLLAAASPELLSGRGQVTVSVSNSALNEASGAIHHLLRYPYGCVEQTTSSTLPWLAMRTLGKAVPGVKRSPAEVSDAIQKGVNRLLSMQTDGGGLGYWPNAPRPELWATTYGGMGLALARDAGALVPPDRLDQLAAYLSSELRNAGSEIEAGQLYERAFACYTLALLGKPEPAYHEVLARKLNLMPHPARALLALAILSSGGSTQEAQMVLDHPIDPPLEEWRGNIFDSRLTAMNLLVWIRIDPAHATTAALTERVLQERTSWGDWGSTYENGWALLALAADHQSRAGQLSEGDFEIGFADQKAQVSLKGDETTRSVTLPFNGQPSARRLTLTGRQPGSLRVAIEVEARPALVPVQPRNEGFGISRTYAKVAPDGTTAPADALEVGDLVAVTLELKVPAPCRYVAVDDPLPAIFEAVNPRFTSQSRTATVARDAGDPVLSWMGDHQELRNDRALFFSDHLWRPGTFRLSYLARVVAEGVVTAPPAKIEAMYEPDRHGLSGSQRVSSKAAPGKMAGQSR